MSRVGWIIGGGVWFLLVFLFSFRLTFPSDAVADRIDHELGEATDGAMRIEMSKLSPWWIGASAQSVRLFQRDARRDEETLTFAADSARARVGVMSLLRQSPTVSGAVALGSGQVDFVVGTRLEEVQLRLGEVELSAHRLPISELAALAGASVSGMGHVDVEVSLDAEEGISRSRGRASLRGRGLQISDLDLSEMGVPDLGLEIPIDELDLTLDIVNGKAQVVRGLLRSELATLEVTGDLTLRDDLARSGMNLELAVGSLGPSLQMFKSFLGTERADGRFYFRCTGQLQRPNCRAESERGAARPGGRLAEPSRAVDSPRSQRLPRQPRMVIGDEAVRGGDEAERAKRREEMRERLRARREGAVPAAIPVSPDRGTFDEEYDDEDEEFIEDDLGDEEFLDDEFEEF